MVQKYDVLIAGNGVLGLSLAWELTQRDPSLQVAIVGPKARPGCASWAAGAMLNCFAEVDIGTLEHPIKKAKLELAMEARSRWPAFLEALSAASGTRLTFQEGTTLLHNAAGDRLDDDTLDAVLATLRAYDEPFQEICPSDIAGYNPAPRSRALRAIHLPREAFLPSVAVLDHLTAALTAQAQVTFVDAKVQKLTLDGASSVSVDAEGTLIQGNRLVIAAGSASQPLLDQLPCRDAIPRLFYGIGTAVVLECEGLAPSHVLRTVNRGMACGIHAVPYGSDQVYVGASNMVCPWPEPARLTSLHGILGAAMTQLHTGLYKARVLEQRVGYRPTTLDTFPLVGKTSLDNVFVLTGTKREGIHFAPLWGAVLADEVLGREPDVTHPFAPERKLIHTLSKEEGIALAMAHARSGAVQHGLEMPSSGWDPMVDAALRRSVEEGLRRLRNRLLRHPAGTSGNVPLWPPQACRTLRTP